MLVYNVHGLVQLAEDASRFGCLDNISAFPFENFLGKLKRMVRKPSFPLEQVGCTKNQNFIWKVRILRSSHQSLRSNTIWVLCHRDIFCVNSTAKSILRIVVLLPYKVTVV